MKFKDPLAPFLKSPEQFIKDPADASAKRTKGRIDFGGFTPGKGRLS